MTRTTLQRSRGLGVVGLAVLGGLLAAQAFSAPPGGARRAPKKPKAGKPARPPAGPKARPGPAGKPHGPRPGPSGRKPRPRYGQVKPKPYTYKPRKPLYRKGKKYYWHPTYVYRGTTRVYPVTGYPYYVGGTSYTVVESSVPGQEARVPPQQAGTQVQADSSEGVRYLQMLELTDLIHHWRSMNESEEFQKRAAAAEKSDSAETKELLSDIKQGNERFDEQSREAMGKLAGGEDAEAEIELAGQTLERLFEKAEALPPA